MPKLVVADVPGLSPDLLRRGAARAPFLAQLAAGGGWRPLRGVFPALTCPLHATWTTGLKPAGHGMVANGFFDRQRLEVHFWDRSWRLVAGRRIWQELAARKPGARTAVLFWQNSTSAPAAVVLSEAAAHEAGQLFSYCFSRPAGLYGELAGKLGPFSILDFWGPLAGAGSTRWIARATAAVLAADAPQLTLTYLPQLDYTLQRHGPGGPEALADLALVDEALALLHRAAEAAGAELAVVSGYGIAPVERAVFPNRALREAGLLAVRQINGREHLDCGESAAFAVADHQVAHLYCAPGRLAEAAAIVAGLPGVERVAAGAELEELGLAHPRCGEAVALAAPGAWLAYEWWADEARAPGYAATMDIHRKPGYDPLELFPGAKLPFIARDHKLVRGSHGRPQAGEGELGVLVAGRLAQGLPEELDSVELHGFLLAQAAR